MDILDEDYDREELLAFRAAFIAQNISLAVVLYASPYYWKQPYHISALSGHAWVRELILGHPKRIQTGLGMRVHIFTESFAKHGLSDSVNQWT
jgi:hypothetical protein